MKFQYIGHGEDPPKTINFMGKYKFTLNHKYIDVLDEAVLEKINGHRCFRKYVATVKKKITKKTL